MFKKATPEKPNDFQIYKQVAAALDIARQQMGQASGVLDPYPHALWLKLHEAQALADKLAYGDHA